MNAHEQFIAFYTIIHKEIARFMRIWTQTLLPAVISITLYFIIFGAFIGSQIKPIKGFSYMQFVVPGFIMMAIIQNTYSNVVSSFFGTKFQKSVEELLVSPTPSYIIILGYCCGGMLRGFIVALLVTATSLTFEPLTILHPLTTVAFVILTAFLFSLIGLTNAIFAQKFDDISIIPTFVLTPLIYLGGVFYSIELLPSFWQKVSLFNPVLYMVNGFRYGFLGVSDIEVWFALTMLVVFIVIFFTINLIFITRGVGLKS